MAVSDEIVGALAETLSSATDDGIAARLVAAVLQAADAPTLSPVCPGPLASDPALIAAAYLDGAAMVR